MLSQYIYDAPPLFTPSPPPVEACHAIVQISHLQGTKAEAEAEVLDVVCKHISLEMWYLHSSN